MYIKRCISYVVCAISAINNRNNTIDKNGHSYTEYGWRPGLYQSKGKEYPIWVNKKNPRKIMTRADWCFYGSMLEMVTVDEAIRIADFMNQCLTIYSEDVAAGQMPEGVDVSDWTSYQEEYNKALKNK